MDILVTAFEPFGGEKLNPSEIVLYDLPDKIKDHSIRKLLLPVEFIRSAEILRTEYDKLSPDAVIMLGQAGGRSAVTPESTGRNIMNAAEPDNAGYLPDHQPIIAGGQEQLYSTLPMQNIIDSVKSLGISCERSDSAGEFVCNCLLYSMLDHNKGEVPTGFIHMPYIKEQGHEDKPYMELKDITKAIMTAIETVISVTESV
jgi:pyroglutamyl-peptidase